MLHKPVWTGIDIGRQSVKAVVLKQNKGRFTLSAYAEVALTPENEPGQLSGTGPLQDSVFPADQLSALRQLRTLLPKRTGACVLSLPDSEVVQRDIGLERRWGQDVASALAQQLAHLLAVDPQSLSLDFHRLQDAETPGHETEMYRVFAAKSAAVEQKVRLAREAGFRPAVMELQARTLLWLLRYLEQNSGGASGAASAIVCQHDSGWDLAASSRHPQPYHRTFPVAGSQAELSRDVTRQLRLSGVFEDVESLWLTGIALTEDERGCWQQLCGLPVQLLTPQQVFPYQSDTALITASQSRGWVKPVALAIRGAMSC
ncbi:type IV pilus biogenesis protein PilM [Photobacterium sp. 53610]|uniref:type IV pilus biogenesis protein PilM n=1 Tax=Photobacterium sp. 53610 TaxID=3102789 RepID=UPI002EDA28D2